MKRLVDVLAAAFGLILLSPVLVCVAVAVKATSRGPVFFKQERVGRHGAAFLLWKFRSMVVDAPEKGPALTTRNDWRVTGVGRVLRATKADELPQLLNVLRGDMSLVGPRPEVPKFVAFWPSDVKQRVLSVRPGLTDSAAISIDEQAMLASATDPEWTYVHDVVPMKLASYERYVASHPLRVDLAILGRTILYVAGLAKAERPTTRRRPTASDRA
jgi:lipopolysaccharide/colanic/teichoic acid biosynthesis glycosyltransferase